MIGKLIIIFLFAILSLHVAMYILPTSPVYAAPTTEEECKSQTFLGLPVWYKYLQTPVENGRCNPQLPRENGNIQISGILSIIIVLLEAALRLSGVVAVVMIFWSSFRFLTSQGNPDAASSARKTLINALIGLVIVVIAVNLVGSLGRRLQTAPDTGWITNFALIHPALGQIAVDPNEIQVPKTFGDKTLLEKALPIVYGVIGAIALLVVIYSGIQFMLSRGDPQKVSQARSTIIYVVVGILVAALAFSLVAFVLGFLE